MSDDRRLLLAVLLCLAVYAGWSWMAVLRRKGMPPPPVQPSAQTATRSSEQAAPPVVAPSAPTLAPPEAAKPEKLVDLFSPDLHLVFSSRGGTLVHAILEKPQYRRHVDGKDVPVDLVRGESPIANELKVSFKGANWPDNPLADYEAEQDASGHAVTFRHREGPVTISKRYELISPYLVSLQVTEGGGTAQGLAVSYGGEQPPGGGASPGGFLGKFARSYPNTATALCRVDGSNKSSAADKDAQTTLPEGKLGVVQFGGLDERFFVAAIEPQGDRDGNCTISSTKAGQVVSEISLPLKEGAPVDKTFGVFLGPKDLDLLQKSAVLPGHAENAELATAVGFGFWTALCVPMLRVMQFFNHWVPNWGVAILVLTVVMKLLMSPLTHAQYRSMEKMKALAPKMAELKKKFGEDKERLNVETMKLYSENKVNPLGGCLPMLLQLPIWWALYRLLGTTIQLYREPFIPGWINDLTAPDPYFILPIGMGVTMLVTQLLSPQAVDGGQQKLLMYMMPIMMTAFFLNLPAGLNLYIVASNLLSIAQQYWVRARTRPPGPPPPPGVVAAAGA